MRCSVWQIMIPAMVLLSSCGREDQQPLDSYSESILQDLSLSEKDFRARIDAAIQAPRTAAKSVTVEIAEGVTVPALVPPSAPVFPATIASLSEKLPRSPSPLGEELFSISDSVKQLVVADSGEIFYATPKGLFHWSDAPTPTLIKEGAITQLQLDAESQQLVLLLNNELIVYTIDGMEARQFEGYIPRGIPFWLTSDRLLFFHSELVDPRAASEVRTAGSAMIYRLTDSGVERTDWSALRFSRVGTLPALDAIWGHLTIAFRVDPFPAPIFRLDGDELAQSYTADTESIDLMPSAADDGTMVWIRSQRREGSSARGYRRNVLTETVPLAMTAMDTSAIAISPNGQHIVYTERRSEDEVFYRVAGSELTEEVLMPYEAIVAEQRLRAHRFRESVEATLRNAPEGASLRETRNTEYLVTVPSKATMTALAEAFREGLREHYNLDLGTGPVVASNLDVVLADLRDFLTESPAMVLAIGTLFAEAIDAKAPWVFEGETEDLSLDVEEAIQTDRLFYTALQPIGAARLALANQRSLASIAEEALALRNVSELVYTENFEEETFAEHRRSQLVRYLGNRPEGITLGELMELMQETVPIPPYLSGFAYEQASALNHRTLRVASALRLVEAQPYSGKAFARLASALEMTSFIDESIACWEIATLLEPQDMEIRLAMGDAFLAADRLTEAAYHYDLFEKLDRFGEFESVLEVRRRMLQEGAVGAGK